MEHNGEKNAPRFSPETVDLSTSKFLRKYSEWNVKITELKKKPNYLIETWGPLRDISYKVYT